MWKLYILILFNYLFLFLGSMLGILSAVSFSQTQRKRFPVLKKLDGKQLHLVAATLIFFVLGYGAYIYKEILTLNLSFELTQSPNTSQAEKATSDGFEFELRKASTERATEASDYFRSAERHFESKEYKDAAFDYQKSINAIPTLSAYLNQGISLRYLSDKTSAEIPLAQGLEVARKKGERKFEANFLFQLGSVYLEELKNKEALDFLQQAKLIFDQIQDSLGQANATLNIGNVKLSEGKNNEALSLYQQALIFYKETNNILGQANVNNNIGVIYMNQYDFDKALPLFESARNGYKQTNNPIGQITVANSFAVIYMYQGKNDEAIEQLQFVTDSAKSIGRQDDQIQAMALMGRVYIEKQEPDEALKREQEVLDLLEKQDRPDIQVFALVSMAEAYLEKNMTDDAQKCGQQALEISKNIDDTLSQLIALNLMGDVYIKKDKLDLAMAAYRETERVALQSNLSSVLVTSYKGIGTVYYKKKNNKEALDYLLKADNLAKLAGRGSLAAKEIQQLIEQLSQEN